MARGGYTFEDIRHWSAEQILYVNHYQEEEIKQTQDFITSALGVIWDRDQLAAAPKDSDEDGPRVLANKLFVPLSAAINPKIIEFARKELGIEGGSTGSDGVINNPYIGGGTYMPKEGEVVKSMASMSKDEFKRFTGATR